jgi:hypothetical protein
VLLMPNLRLSGVRTLLPYTSPRRGYEDCMIAVIIPTYAQITSLLHILAYMFRPFWVIIRALQNTKIIE